MTPLTVLRSIAVPMPDANIDTDIILPARFLLITEKSGLGQYAFYERRHLADGTPRKDFPFNDSRYAGAEILVAGENFGCGSSREHAPWALADLGIRCVIAASFGEIFAGNCVRNGMLPLTLDAASVAYLMMDADAGMPITVDLTAERVVRSDGTTIPFDLPAGWRDSLLNGWDEIDGIQARHGLAIRAFETVQHGGQPWLWKEEISG